MKKAVFILWSLFQIIQCHAQNDTLYFENGKINAIGDTINKKKEGKWSYYYKSGSIESLGVYFNDKRNGEWKWYYENGQQMSLEKYENGKFKEGKFWNEAGKTISINEIIVQPLYPDGGAKGFMDFISSNIHYPTDALKKGIQGKVIVDFNVDKNGDLKDFKIYQSLDSSCDEEAIRVIKDSGKWIPGSMHGEKIKIAMRIPINFVK